MNNRDRVVRLPLLLNSDIPQSHLDKISIQRLPLIIVALLCLTPLPSVRAADWKPAAGPMMTRWASAVGPQNAWPEYPRPQMVRAEWANLNGVWGYAIRPLDQGPPQQWDGQILVPFPIESALSGVMKPLDEKSRLWYRRNFDVPTTWSGRRVLLHFDASDWETTVWVNGRELGRHCGGYDAFSFDVTDAIHSQGPQELLVAVFDPTDAGPQPRGKQVRRPEGIWYTSCSGLWQTVWMEPVAATSLSDLVLTPDLDHSAMRLSASVRGSIGGCTIDATALDGNAQIAHASTDAAGELVLPIAQPKPWSPDKPFLYGLRVTLRRGDQVLDTVNSYFGMRKISLGKDARSRTRMFLNNTFVFQRGPLDQGYWPDGLYTAPTDEALRYDIEMTRQLGFNMTRKHIKVESERWYYWCDKLGLLVWQDMVSGNNNTEEGKRRFEIELRRMIKGRRNHPSIVMWEVFNEGWGQFDTEHLTALVKHLDPTRLVDNATGGADKGAGDVVDVHGVESARAPRTPAPLSLASRWASTGPRKLTLGGSAARPPHLANSAVSKIPTLATCTSSGSCATAAASAPTFTRRLLTLKAR